MIVDTIFTAVAAVLGLVFSALPTVDLSSYLNPAMSVGNTMGGYLALINGFFPAAEVLSMLKAVYLLLLPALVIYKAANWVWRHIPDLWGFGPGSG